MRTVVLADVIAHCQLRLANLMDLAMTVRLAPIGNISKGSEICKDGCRLCAIYTLLYSGAPTADSPA